MALSFLIVVGLVLPILVLVNARQTRANPVADEDLPSVGALAIQTIIFQAIVFGLAWLASSSASVPVSWPSKLEPFAILIAVGIVGLVLAYVWADSKRAPDQSNVTGRVLERSSPTDPAWLALILVAGVTEEFAYRGVLTGLLSQWLGTGGAWLASAFIFGLSHSTQGWRGFLGSAAFGLAMQGVVFLSGGLMMAIVAHGVYDFSAVYLSSWLRRRDCR